MMSSNNRNLKVQSSTVQNKFIKWIISCSLVLLVVFALLWYIWRPADQAEGISNPDQTENTPSLVKPPTPLLSRDPPSHQVTTRDNIVASEPDAEPEPSSLGLRPGDRLRYDFSTAQHLELSGPNFNLGDFGKAAGSLNVDVTISGSLFLDVYSELSTNKNYEGWLVEFRFSEFMLERKMAGIANQMTGEISKEMMQSSLLAEVSKTGRIQKMLPCSVVSLECRMLWKDILSGWQVVLPETSGTNTWECKENDATGMYVAEYQRSSINYPQHIKKYKIRYTQISASSSVPNLNFKPKTTLKNEIDIYLNPYQQSIKAEESISFDDLGGGTIKSQREYSFKLNSAVQMPTITNYALQKQQDIDSASELMSWAPENIQHDKTQHLKTPQDFAMLLNSFEELLKAGEAHSSRHVMLAGDLIRAIQAGTPEAVPMLLKGLAKAWPHVLQERENMSFTDEEEPDSVYEEYVASIMGVLGAAATPEAQYALLDIIGSADWPLEIQEMAFESLVQITEPVPEIDQVLMELCNSSKEHAGNALLVLAAIGDRLRDMDTSRRNKIDRFIVDLIANVDSDDKNQMLVTLGTVGNFGPTEIPSIVTTALASKDADIREQAVMSLQRIYTDKAFDMIVTATTDEIVEVRAAAASMLGEPNREGGFDALCKIASNDSSKNVRVSAISALSQWEQKKGEDALINIYTKILKTDSSEEVRDAARSRIEFLRGDEQQ